VAVNTRPTITGDLRATVTDLPYFGRLSLRQPPASMSTIAMRWGMDARLRLEMGLQQRQVRD
jgi:hypothetical protein